MVLMGGILMVGISKEQGKGDDGVLGFEVLRGERVVVWSGWWWRMD